MDAKYFKILSFLYDKGVGEYTNISPILLELYPGVNRMNFDIASFESGNIKVLLKSMADNKLIQIEPYSIGNGNRSNGAEWIDTVQINATITQQGKDAVDTEKQKGETARLMESTIITNESMREINNTTIQNIRFQKNSQKWAIVLSVLSTVFIIISVFQTGRDKTEEKLLDIQKTIQLQSKIIQNLNSSLDKINSTIQTKKIDTVFVIKKK